MKKLIVSILISFIASKAFCAILQLSKQRMKEIPIRKNERRLFSPIFDAIAYQNYVEYMAKYGGNPMSFTPYAALYQNPFSNPSFAQNFPQAISKASFGPNLLNYMAFNNPLLYVPTGYGNPWKMGDYGIGYSSPNRNHKINPNKEIQEMMGTSIQFDPKNTI